MDAIVQGKQKPARQFEYPDPEVKAIREKTGLSQARFALLIGVSKRTLENWEQGRCLYLVPFLLGHNPQPLDIWHGSNLEWIEYALRFRKSY